MNLANQNSVLESIKLLPEQIRQAWEEIEKIKIPSKFKRAKNIIVVGMGGSALGGRIIDSLKFEALKVPLEIINGYRLPAYAQKNSLVIASSYSGNTEETVACFIEAQKRKCPTFVISTGGKLAELAQKNKLAAYIFEPRYNPSGQPRLGLGYSIMAQLAFLAKCNLMSLEKTQVTELLSQLKKTKAEKTSQEIASKFKEKIIILISAEHLNGAAHAFKNMLNENSKTFSVRFSLPEMNHHLLEGLSYPIENKKILKFLFLESNFYDQKIKKRIKVTKEVLDKNEISWQSLKIQEEDRLIEVFKTVFLGGFISFYLAQLYGINPVLVPWVDFFKKQLAAHEKRK